MNISDLITGGIGSKATSTIANTIGISESKAKWIIAAAVPLMIAALNYNAKNKGQSEAIDKAVEQHNSGGLLDKIGGLLGAGNSSDDGNKIVQHMFGSNANDVTETFAEKSGLNKEQVGSVLATLAPLVLSYLGQQKSANSSGGGIGDMIGSIIGGGSVNTSTGGLGGILSGILGGGSSEQTTQENGNTTDSLADLAGEFFNKGNDKSNKGSILENIAGMFAK